MAKRKNLLPGSRADIEVVSSLFDKALALVEPRWGRSTLNHRLTGSTNFDELLRDGHISMSRMAMAKIAVEKFIKEQDGRK